jgi:carboxyl-terminal processing protease
LNVAVASAQALTRAAAVLCGALLAGCGDATSPPADTGGAASAYLATVLGIMQANALHRNTIDWGAFRAQVTAAAAAARTTADTYEAIRVALGLLGDGHSQFFTPGGAVIAVPTRSCNSSPVPAADLPEDIGYIRVRSFSGTPAQATAYADSLQQAIRTADRAGLAGWIVDLRRNSGGNMWPMLAGTGPVLGEGIVGYFIDPDGGHSAWEYADGASRSNGAIIQRVTTPYRLLREAPRVAVLTDGLVASSGEAVAIAFRGRTDTRSFGTPTCGLSTANRQFALSDGAVLNLTVSVMADRNRTQFGDRVVPDERVEDPRQTLLRAIDWIRSGS